MTFGWRIVGPLLVVAATIALGQSDSMQRGIDLFKQDQYEAALQHFQKASRLQPNNPMIENMIGITETKLGRIQQANSAYKLAIHLNPKLPAPHKNLGFNYLNANSYSQAETELRSTLVLDETDPFVHYYLAILYLKTNRNKDAILHFRPAEPLIENDPPTAFLMTTCLLQADAFPEAMRVMEATGKTAAFTPEQEYQLATLLSSKQRYRESLQHFKRIAEMQPTSWIAKYNLAIALIDNGQPSDADPVLQTLATERPNDVHILSLLGSVCESRGKLPEALDAYEKAVGADPENANLYLDYTRLLMDLDRYDDAIELIRHGIKHTHDDYALRIRLAAVEMMKGEYDKARESFQQGIEERPDVAVGYVGLAKTYMKQGDDKAAAKVLEEARGRVTRDFALEYISGLVFSQLGRSQQAIDALKNAETIDPAVVEPHYQLGRLYMESEEWTEAKTELERVLVLDPTHAPAHYQLSKVYERMGDTKKARDTQAEASQLMRTQRQAALDEQRARIAAFQPQ